MAATLGALLAPTATATAKSSGPVVRSLSLAPAVVAPGGSTQATARVANPDALSLQVRFFLSATGHTPGATVLATRTLPASGTVTTTLVIPSVTLVGDYSVIACVLAGPGLKPIGGDGAKDDLGTPPTCVSTRSAALSVVPPAHLVIDPVTHPFGLVAIDTDSPAKQFTVTNDGGLPSGPVAMSITGAGAGQFSRSAGCAGSVLAAGASCTLTARFHPTSAGLKTASLTATATPGESASATLTGTGATPAHLVISPTSHPFGNVLVNGTSGAQSFTVTNDGDLPSSAITVSAPSGFVAGAGCSGSTLAGGASCTFSVTFQPTARGAVSGSLTASATTGGSASATVSGTGVTPAHLVITPASYGFGPVAVNTTSPAKSFTVTNDGDLPTSAVTVTPSAGFSVTATCNVASLAGGATCSFDATFNPTALGVVNGSLTAAATTGGAAAATVSGTGVNPAHLSISPNPFPFADTQTNTDSANQLFTVVNDGGLPSSLISTSTSDPSQFPTSANGCNGMALAPGESCMFAAKFHPTSRGLKTATLSATATTGGAATSAVSGTGKDPAHLTVTLASGVTGAYGNVQVNTNSGVKSFTITNDGDLPSGTITVGAVGANPGQFNVGAVCTGTTLAPGASCTFGALFRPTSLGAKSANIGATATPGGSSAVAVSGTGVATAAHLALNGSSPATINAAGLAANKTASYVTVIDNTGDADAVGVTYTSARNSGQIAVTAIAPGVGFPTCGTVIVAHTSCSLVWGVQTGANPAPAWKATLTVSGTPGGTVTQVAQTP